jgi:hypothetical protein
VVEPAYTTDLKSVALSGLRVRVSPGAWLLKENIMARQGKKLTESWNVQYYARDTQTNQDVLNLTMSWEFGDTESVKKNLNTWLSAIGIALTVTDKK